MTSMSRACRVSSALSRSCSSRNMCTCILRTTTASCVRTSAGIAPSGASSSSRCSAGVAFSRTARATSRCHWNSGWRIWLTARPADSGAISARSSRASGERRAEATRRAPSKLHETMIGDAGERLDVLARVADDDAIQLHPGMRLQTARSHLDADREPAARDATTTEHPLNRQRAHQTLRPEDPVHGGTRDGPAYFLDVLKAHRLLLRRSRLEVQQLRNRRSPGPNLTGDQVALRLQQQPDVTRRKCPDAPTPDRQRFHGPQCPAIR